MMSSGTQTAEDVASCIAIKKKGGGFVSKFRVGDNVVLVDGRRIGKRVPGWVSWMTDHVGETFTVKEVSGNDVFLNDPIGFIYFEDWLEPVSEIHHSNAALDEMFSDIG